MTAEPGTDQGERRHARPVLLVRAYELVLTGVAILWLALPKRGSAVAVLAAWDTLAGCYLAGAWLALRRNRLLGEAGLSTDRLPSARFTPAARRATLVFTLVASLAGMAAAGTVVVEGATGGIGPTVKVLGVLAVIAAWLLLHAGYARYYLYLYYDAAAPGGLRFPDDVRPAVVDFTYFSLSLGTSFAVSDVEVTSQRTRFVVMGHSVVGFFYNTLVIAVVVGVLTQG